MADKLIRVNAEIHVMASQVISVRYVGYSRVYVAAQWGEYSLVLGCAEPAHRARDRFTEAVNAALQGAV